MTKPQFNLNQLIRPNVKKLKPYSSARDEFKDTQKGMVFLDANENPFETDVNRYPDPQQRDLKTAIAQQKKVNPNQLLLGNGSDEVLDLLFRSFCIPGIDNCITLPPTYGMYDVLAQTNDVENHKVLLDRYFNIRSKAILDVANTHSKLLFICSPNNPTGNVINEKAVVDLLLNFSGLVVIDEAYIDFTTSQSWIDKLDTYPNLVVIQTLSKAYGMAGVRLGMCFASPEIITVLNKIKPPYNVNQLTQHKALQRIVKKEIIAQEVDEILKERKRVVKELLKTPFIKTVYPSQTNFILAKVDDAQLRYNQLIDNGVVIRNRSTQALCENTLRFTVGTKTDNDTLFNALKSIS